MSQTILLKNLYLSLENSSQKADKSFINDDITEERIQEHFDDTFEELFIELEKKYGEIEEMNIISENCYVKFRFEEDAEKAVADLNNGWFDGCAMDCPRGGFCNFMHLKPISKHLRKRLYQRRQKMSRCDSRSPSADGRSRSRSHDYDRRR
ncbi:unnamed protein product [Rotaria sordida]|uniref:RRM domain-containing protein n=1 Tax=Rotaria sordida TaxID=392033 RepID=A0A819WD75_9BILA|nr:unnamed protein product [Rotaria sordida]CAF4122842.1 unnamed protein product [Rotaria sordida]